MPQDHAVVVASPDLGTNRFRAQHRVYRSCGIRVYFDFITRDDLHHAIKGRRQASLTDCLLCPAQARLIVAQGDGVHATDEIRKGRVQQQVIQTVPVGGADQLHTAFGDGARGGSLSRSADLVDNDHFRHVVLHRLDH